MLFNSYIFIFAFLPLTLAGYALAGRYLGREPALAWLVAASLFFYSWWNPDYLSLILFSMLFNYAVGRRLGGMGRRSRPGAESRWLLAVGVLVNLALLGYYKYANFFVDNLSALTGVDYQIGTIVLPLAISFFTFQQIAYLVDARQGITREYDFLHYALFVTFFPQLIAGPIVHHKEMLPQFTERTDSRLDREDLAVGLSIFSMGLFKKAVLADGIAQYATPVFARAATGGAVDMLDAWGGALAYTLQLYFDFSGYTDMAIGAARMFGIRLPLNFHSPYKAASISEFWRRWHMTLSRFLRDYLYIPLGGNRRGGVRRHLNLMVTMLLGGLWHGAGWTFVIWGGLHGLYLVINHAWRHFARRVGLAGRGGNAWARGLSWLLTFVAVVVAWVFFRAENLDAAMNMLRGMAGLQGISLPNGIAVRLGPLAEWLSAAGVDFHLGGGRDFVFTWLWIVALLPVVLFWPNTQQVMANYRPALSADADEEAAIWGSSWLAARLRWGLTPAWAIITAAVTLFGLLALTEISEFLYFQF